MDSQKYEIQWYGSYKLYGTKDDSIFTQPVANQAGIYLWTIPFKNKYLVYYVGETGRSFATRFTEHTRDYLYGFYRVYDPQQFTNGKKRLVWGGMWKPSTRGPHRMLEFLNRYTELSSIIYKFIEQFRVFLAPLDVQKRIRQRIEGAIANRLLEQPGLIGKFQDSDIRYRPRRIDEKPVSVKMAAFEPILGLCSELLA